MCESGYLGHTPNCLEVPDLPYPAPEIVTDSWGLLCSGTGSTPPPPPGGLHPILPHLYQRGLLLAWQ